MDGGHAVGAVRPDDREVGHADPAFRSLLDKAHPPDALRVPGEAGTNVIQEAPVDLEDDLRVTGQQYLEPRDRPLLESFRQKGVVRVCQGPLRDVPRLVPSEVSLVEKNAHQLGNRHRRVRIVELNGDLFREPAPIGVAKAEASHEIGERAGDEEILLHEAECLPNARRVVGIEHPGEIFGRERLRQGTDVLAVAECLEVEGIRCGCGPEAKRVNGRSSVPDHGAIVRNSVERGRRADHRLQSSSPHLDRGVQLHLDPLVRTGDLPRVGSTEPVVGLFLLPAVLDGLPEDAVFVPQAIAHGRDLHRGHGVEKASRQAPQASVAETRVGFLLQEFVPIEFLSLDHFAHERVEQKVGSVVGQRSADEKLHREVVDALAVLALIGLLRTQPSLREDVAHGAGCGLETLASADGRRFPDVIEEEVPFVQRIGRSGEPDGAATVLLH